MKIGNIIKFISNRKLEKILIGLLVIRIGYLWAINWQVITKPFDVQQTEQRYYQSQWFDPRSKTPIDDEELYEYVGYAFIKKGLGAFEANPEMPPFGKYIIGWVEITSGWSKLTGPIFSTLYLILLTILAFQIFKLRSLAVFSTLTYSFQPLYYENFWRSHLDTIVLCFLILGMIFLSKHKYMLGILMFGFLPALKFSAFYLFLAAFTVLTYILMKRNNRLLTRLPVLLIPLLLSYLPFFLQGNSVVDWLKNEKWIVEFYRNSMASSPLYNPIVMLLTGYWKQWWGEYAWVRFAEWNIFWPVSIMITTFCLKRIRKSDHVRLILIWLIVYIGALLFTLPIPKYFMLTLPFLYITTFLCFEKLAVEFDQQ